MPERQIISTHGTTWAVFAQRDEQDVILAVVRANGRGPDALPESPLVVLDDRAQLDLAGFLIGDDGESDDA